MVNMDILKDNVGKKAADLIKDGQIVGLGTGSTTHYFIRYLGERIKNEELNILGIPTSYQSLIKAREAGINTTTLDEYDIDIAVDGADEVNPTLDLIKGGGAAHTLEKLVDSSAKKFVVIVDESKVVEELGKFPVPLEIIPEALRVVKDTLVDLGGKPELRMGIQKDGPVITDNGNFILDKDSRRIPVDFVNTGNNHHVAIYRKPVLDKKGQAVFDENGELKFELEEVVVSFFDAVTRVNLSQPIIDKDYKRSEGWKFLFSMKQNEYFVFPNEKTGFDPKEIDLLNPENYALISPNLFRVQKIASKDYVFRHHLETVVADRKELQEITWKRISSLSILNRIIKVRVNHIGQIVMIGEY